MDKLIEALQILRKYGNPPYPTSCEHDVLIISPDIDPDKVSEEDKTRLTELGGFHVTEDYGPKCFQSFRFGSS